MKKIKHFSIVIMLSISMILVPFKSKADLFGGDVAVLLQILVQAIQQVVQLKAILENGKDSLNLIKDLNSGIRAGLDIIKIINPKFDAGVYGDMKDPQVVLRAIRDLYGQVPMGADSELLDVQDQSVAETISMNRNLYDYADQVDKERDRILNHAQVTSPQGSAKLQNQSLAVLIGVTTQLLRTQSQMMKLLAQNMALETRKQKVSNQQFTENYESISRGIDSIPKDVSLPTLKDGGGK
jgi:hypothetical protein